MILLCYKNTGCHAWRVISASHVTVQGACDTAACVVEALIMLCCRIIVDNSSANFVRSTV